MAWSVKYDPTLPGSNTPVAPATGGVALAGQVPIVGSGINIAPPSGALSAVGAAVALGLGVTPPSGAIVVAGQTPVVLASGAPFDFYISPTGSDSNLGTLASPWAITSLVRNAVNSYNVANRAALAGKRVGLLPGTYAVYNLWITGVTNLSGNLATASSSSYGTYSYTNPVLALPDGTSTSARTFVGASDSSGYQTIGSHPASITHAITASPSGTPGGGLPGYYSGGLSSQSIAIIGHDPRDSVGHNQIYGIAISDSTNLVVSFYGSASNTSQSGAITDCWLTNCLVYNCGGNEGNNTGAVWFGGGASNSGVQNCIIHDCQIPWPPATIGAIGTQHNCAGIFSEASINNLYEYNTVYNCNCAIYDKNQGNGGNTIRYNYLEVNGWNPYDCMNDCAGGYSGSTEKVYNNIFVLAPLTSNERSFYLGICTDGPGANPLQNLQFYNNTCYVLSGGGAQVILTYQSPGSGSVTNYNNIFVSAAPGFYDTLNFNSTAGAIALSNYNAFIGGCGGGNYFGLGTNGAPATNYSFTSWKALGYDVNSFVQASESGVFSSPGGAQNPTGYQLASGSPCLGAGRVGGTSGGAAIDQGAWGGTDVNTGMAIAQIGSSL